MRTHRFGRKIKLPATITIKHQIRMLMAQDELKKAEAKLIEQSAGQAGRDGTLRKRIKGPPRKVHPPMEAVT